MQSAAIPPANAAKPNPEPLDKDGEHEALRKKLLEMILRNETSRKDEPR
jgi:hypothetical protein